MRPGIKTTEFWLTAAALAVTTLVNFGLVPAIDQDLLLALTTKVITGVAAVVALGLYIRGRATVKQADAEASRPPAAE